MVVDKPYSYSEKLLAQCATQVLGSSSSTATSTSSIGEYDDSNGACQHLYRDYQVHYQRPRTTALHTMEDRNGHSIRMDRAVIEERKRRYDQFLDSVVFVYEHNSRYDDAQQGESSTIHSTTGQDTSPTESQQQSHPSQHFQTCLNHWSDRYPHEIPMLQEHHHTERLFGDNNNVTASTFDYDEIIDQQYSYLPSINLLSSHHKHHSHHHHKQHQHLHPNNKTKEVRDRTISITDTNTPHNNKYDSMLPFWIRDDPSPTTWKQSNQNNPHHHHHHRHHHHRKKLKKMTALQLQLAPKDDQKKKRNKVNDNIVVFDFNVDEENQWKKYLNWSTNDNPDGVPIVNPSVDQGSCGSCWAFAATGTLEANASRHAAYAKFWSIINKNNDMDIPDHESTTDSGDERSSTSSMSSTSSASSMSKDPLASLSDETRQEAVQSAQKVEQSIFSKKAKLSAQELVDCDTKYDQGCLGGNPLLSYSFIHEYGLVSSSRYPYIAKQSKCHSSHLSDPIATVESWGILSPKDDLNMELVLRYIGPIAVALNGSDKAFLAYKGGIYDSKECKNSPNHAMLIVGYGEEYDKSSKHLIKYWIARNSWGTGWGENGYIRVKRKKNGSSGVCGIAKNPSIALGGTFIDFDPFDSGSYDEAATTDFLHGGSQTLQVRMNNKPSKKHHGIYSSFVLSPKYKLYVVVCGSSISFITVAILVGIVMSKRSVVNTQHKKKTTTKTERCSNRYEGERSNLSAFGTTRYGSM